VFLDVLTVPLFPQGSYLDVIFVIPCVPPQSYDLILDLRLPVQMRSPLVVLELSIMLPFLYLCFPLLLSCILSILVIMYRQSLLIHTHIHHVLFRCWFPIRWAERNNLFVSHQNLSRPLNHDADVISERGVSACACGYVAVPKFTLREATASFMWRTVVTRNFFLLPYYGLHVHWSEAAVPILI
jgi:hypothetical protein